jgi:hypothetical protein
MFNYKHFIKTKFKTSQILFLWLKTPRKISKHYDKSFWEKSKPRRRKKEKFPLAPMGVLAPGSSHASPPWTPAKTIWRTCLGVGGQKDARYENSTIFSQKEKVTKLEESYIKIEDPSRNCDIFYLHMARPPQDALPIVKCRGLSSCLFHSEHWGWPHLSAELDGNGFFLEFTSCWN